MAAIYSKGDGAAALYELKRLAECFMPGCELRPSAPLLYQHPARSAAISWRGVALGSLYELHPSLIEAGRGAILDLDLRALMPLAAVTAQYTPLQRYPSSAFDLSILAGLRELSGALEAKIAAAAGALLDSIEFLRVYEGPPLPDDRKSVSFRVTVAAPDRTLSSDEVTAVRQQIIDALRAEGYDLRL
jgi:phenylalanyl-tRNA synthetase beta chain